MSKKINTQSVKPKNTKTRKKVSFICGKLISKNNNGWKTIEIWGSPFERGFAHGYLLYTELKRLQKALPFLIQNQLEISLKTYTNLVKTQILPIVKRDFQEIYQEIRGISMGALKQGVKISTTFLLNWNSYMSVYSIVKDGNVSIQRCSAFIATGDATEKGDIVMAHNTHTDLLTGQLGNIVLKIRPENGFEFTMQTIPGMVASVADWYVSSSGLVCCETTISEINYKPVFGSPYFCRIRETIQYAKNLDDCVELMTKNNAGDYACSWLFGDINTGEIMLYEMGLKIQNVQRTKNGAFYGMNSAIDFELRNMETMDTDIFNPKTSTGNRNYRLDYLINQKYYGKINIRNAQIIISDHYQMDPINDDFNKNSICKHTELDPEAHFKPYSCTDGKVINTNMAKTQTFMGRFGSACGKRHFQIKKYVKEHPEYQIWGTVLEDMPIYDWTKL
jgi:hypothetical protein